ncbi:hatching enzyme 1.2-like [Uranotaenia lowii]|uniref:hatching enzyme 1.2-like n=1 Tax=Uranotaenia lowii TaxID=190385 RepID=UPI00247ABE65|nr:hatching enzyme 1.2-like [Uranotaenia lowii]
MYLKCILLLCAAELIWTVLGEYHTPSEEVGKRVANYDPKVSRGYPFELGLGYYFQGDIMLEPPKKGRVSVSERYVAKIWPRGRVPYQISGNFTQDEISTIHAAIAMYNEHTCVRFVRRGIFDAQYIKIVNSNAGCYSYVGRSTNNQYNLINLQTPSCLYSVGTPVHEMMHAIGFYHEFTRPDRDDWITINRSALVPEYQTDQFFNANWGKVDANEVDLYNITYNYGSVMHYSKYAGAASAEYPVMDNKQPWDGDFGNEQGFAQTDIDSINIRYKCAQRKNSNKSKSNKKLTKSKITQ